MKIDWKFPYQSNRMPVMGRNLVATTHPLAAQAGLRMLMNGGNAVDAALATAIALCVLEPVSTGVGGDAICLVWDGKKLHGVNGTGRSPAGWTPDMFDGLDAMPVHGWKTVTVPGGVATWVSMSSKFGKLPFADLFVPAIQYAEEGFCVPPYIARIWRGLIAAYRKYPGVIELYTNDKIPPKAGDTFRLPLHAETLREIARTKGESLYNGALAERIVDHAKAEGVPLTPEDLSGDVCNWVEPITQTYRGYTLHEIPPNTQGLASLIALGILENFDLSGYGPDSAEAIHLQIEAMKLAFADAYHYIGDPEYMGMSCEDFLNPDYLRHRAKQIDVNKARYPEYECPKEFGTIYLTAADRSGMVVSMMQSNGRGFGSGIVIPGTGICLQSRGNAFSLKKGHPNFVGGGKKPFHTIIPAFLSKDGQPVLSFGVMGFNMQPQAHVQVVVRLVDFGQNPQAISDAPRWRIAHEEPAIVLEPGFPDEVIESLQKRGHEIVATESYGGANTPFGSALAFGSAQMIYCLPDGYLGVSDHRRDGQAVAL